MAKHTGKKGRYLRGNINSTVTLGTLGANALVSSDIADVVTEQARVSSIEVSISIRDLTSGEGPITVGVAHSDYTDAEMEEVLENVGSWEIGDKVQQEVAKRLVRVLGQINSIDENRLSDGDMIKTRLNWGLATGQTLAFFAFNKSGATLTTGAFLIVEGHANIWSG